MDKRILLTGSYLWDGIKENTIPDGGIIVEGETIIEAGVVHDIAKDQDLHVINCPDCTLMPGMIDSHTHLSMDASLDDYLDHMKDSVAELTIRASQMIKKDLLSGVTFCRCLGDREFLDVKIKRAVLDGRLPGPDLFIATRGIRAPEGHGFVGYPFKGEDQIREAIRENIETGADLIKLYITGTLKGDSGLPAYLTKDELKAAIEEAHHHECKVAAHCVGGIGLEQALELGLDTLEHAYHISDEQIDRLASSDTHLVLTPGAVLNDSIIRRLPQNLIDGHFREQDMMRKSMASLIQAEIPFGLGTDGHHGALSREMQYAMDLGASNYEILRAVTIEGALLTGLSHKKGSIEPGKDADVIAVKRNPMEDINQMDHIKLVMKRGEIIDNKCLKE